MRRIQVEHLQPNMVLAKPIYTEQGVILLKEGSVLTEAIIDKVKSIEVSHIYINDTLSEGIIIDTLVSEEVKQATTTMLHETMDKMRQGYFVATEDVLSKVEAIIEEIVSNHHVLVSLQDMRTKEEYMYHHAMNVCVISLLIGKKMGYNSAQLKHLAMGAILHDVGKTQIDSELAHHYRAEYSEAEFKLYRLHVRQGYEIIKNMKNGSLLAANVALTHHEHYDGSGFPLGKKNTSIHEYARIVAVANEYDNLLYNLPKDNQMRHYEIVEMIASRAYTWFDPEVVKIFNTSISPYPVSTGVILSDKRVGIVAKLNENIPTRPIVRIFDEKTRQVIEEIDLSQSLNIMIIGEKDIDK